MRYVIWIFISFQCHVLFSQHSDRFIELVQNLKPVDSSYNENSYTDGSLKNKGLLVYYEMPEYTYSKKTGIWMEYYRNGTLKMKSEYDNWGNVLSKSLYNLDGSISSEMITTFIDSDLPTSKDYFRKNESVWITIKIKNYRFGKSIGKTYLREVGFIKGGKRIGTWKTYSQIGKLEKEMNYDSE